MKAAKTAAKIAKVFGLECLKCKATFSTHINLIYHQEKGKCRCHGNRVKKVLGLECLKCNKIFSTHNNLIRHMEKGKYRCHGNRVRSSYLILSYRGVAERGRKRRIAMREMQGFVLHLKANVQRQRKEFAEGKSGMVMFTPLDVGLPFYAKDVHSIAEELCRSAHISPRSAGTASAQLQTRLLTGAALCSVFWTVSAAKLVGCPPLPLTAIYMKKLGLRIFACTRQGIQIFNSHIVDFPRTTLINGTCPVPSFPVVETSSRVATTLE